MRLILVTLVIGGFCFPVQALTKVCAVSCGILGLPQLMGALWPGDGILLGCGWAYNSYAPALLVASLLLICRHRAESVLPLALALLVPLSPLGGIGLLPLVALRWWKAFRQGHGSLWTLPRDFLLPLWMAFLVAVYFLRSEGSSVVAFSPAVLGWEEFFSRMFRIWLGWLPLLLPLCFVVRRDAFFYVLLACCLLLPALFIGSPPSSGFQGYNELSKKSDPSYMLMVGFYWLRMWRLIPWYKYGILAVCWGYVGWFHVRLPIKRMGEGRNAYLQVDDCWNGHLNHDAPFLNQSVPPCREPLVPGLMLRESGASERHFPGSLLPAAPGCDYSRPALWKWDK